ncbi:hypothetical protein BDB01DRAFT_853744 [Pilobolus umbonatus]|nr:hypothetical protein BDB01DRAFT_853744 [Pilobolus umbonatus]
MNIQGYSLKEDHPHHYAEVGRTEDKPFTIPAILPPISEEPCSTNRSTPSTSNQDPDKDCLNPALLLNRYDKRKSSPAILGLPFGLKHEAQLSLHLSQQRNSIEAAMLLANFNKVMSFPKTSEIEVKDKKVVPHHWQDDMSIPSTNVKKNSWSDVSGGQRRHSFDVNMSWDTMPEAFLDRPDLMNTSSVSTPSTVPPPVFNHQEYKHMPTKVSWSHEDVRPLQQHPHQQYSNDPIQHTHHTNTITPHTSNEYPPISPRQHNRLYHPSMSSPLMHYHRYPLPPQDHHHHVPMLHPLARQPELGQKREHDPPHIHYYPYTFPPPPSQLQPPLTQRFYYPNGKLPLPAAPSILEHHHPVKPPRRKKQKATPTPRVSDEFDEDGTMAANEEDYPDMSPRDIEAARSDPEARPRKQKLRFLTDKYTPQWVRYNGQAKEGLCDTCKPGKWLQLKNSAYWYHKQFFHGISSVSGKEFVQPLETRWVDQDLVEGLCHQCHQWVAVSNVKRKNSVLWYRHAHKCHVYHKPKPSALKKR